MATVTETLKPFDATMASTRIVISLRDDRDEAGDLLPVADRLYFEKPEQMTRSDGLELQYPLRTLQVADSLDTFDAGDAAALRALLLKLYNATENA
jgi:hypothetical protein